MGTTEAGVSDARFRVVELIIRAAKETTRAINDSPAGSEDRRVLVMHLRDQTETLSRYTGYPISDMLDFLRGQQPDVAKALSRKVGRVLVNSLGYEIGEEKSC